jgi:ABC-2 type transport system ATP-binding protein
MSQPQSRTSPYNSAPPAPAPKTRRPLTLILGGILWIGNLLKGQAAEGRTVFVSSHLISEMALTAEHLIVVGRGRLIRDVSVREFINSGSTNSVTVDRRSGVTLRRVVNSEWIKFRTLRSSWITLPGRLSVL